MFMFAIGFLTIVGLIPTIAKLEKTERDFSELVQSEHEKTLAGIKRYNTMKNQPE